jgi:hypothetical protein
MGRAHRYPNLAMFAMPKGSDTAMSLATLWDDHWFTHAHQVLLGEKLAIDNWQGSREWM